MRFLDCSLDIFFVEVRNMLHRVKYGTEEHVDWLYNVEVRNKEDYSEEEFERLCIMATFVQAAFEKQCKKPPDWVLDGRLWIEPAFVDSGCTPSDIFRAYQASFDHNVFMPRSSFEVV